jgi:hypothetical protein
MEVEATKTNHTPKKQRSDKGTRRGPDKTTEALSAVLAALKGLHKDEVDRVLTTASTFFQIDEPEPKGNA